MTNTTRRTIAALAAVATLGACSGGGSTDSGGSDAPQPQALADKIGCDSFEAETEQLELGSREQGFCDLGDETLTIHTYKSNEPRDTAQKIAEEFGGIAVVGDRFVVRVDTQATAERVQAAVGGDIR